MNLKNLYYIIPGFLLASALSLYFGFKGINNLEKSLMESIKIEQEKPKRDYIMPLPYEEPPSQEESFDYFGVLETV